MKLAIVSLATAHMTVRIRAASKIFTDFTRLTDTGIEQLVRHQLTLTPMHDPPIPPNPIWNRNLHSISLGRKCHPEQARLVVACSARQIRSRKRKKERRGLLRCMWRGLHLPTPRTVHQDRVIMRVVRWIHSRKDPVLPEPRSQSPQHSRTALSLKNIERLLSEDAGSISPQRFRRTGTCGS
jgi:hypothetical protein